MGHFRTSCYYICVILVLAAFLSACSGEPGSQTLATPEGALPVDPVFREFHRALGGTDLLGYAISPLIYQDDVQCQYTEKALMCYNPLLSQQSRYYLASLGHELNRKDNPQPFTQPGRARVVDGYLIFDEFLPLYDKLYGERYVGNPLTQVRYDPSRARYEQYFENLGFYRRLDEPAGQVHLMDYGAARCGLDCTYNGRAESAIGPALTPEIYLSQINRLGGSGVFGQALTGPFALADGSILQVYERAVFFAPRGDLSEFSLKPAARELDILSTPPVERLSDSRMVFHPLPGGLGHNVPVIFDQFIAQHGNTEISGAPISEISLVKGQNLYRQCFENYCLDYDPTAPAGLTIRLASIGQAYIEHNHLEAYVTREFIFTPDTVLLQAGEASPQIPVGGTQEFYLVALQARDQHPLEGVGAMLSVFLPDGRVVDLSFPPTGSDGRSTIQLPPQPSIPNGTVVQYQVCLDVQTQQPLCDTETYLVWNSN